MNYPTIEWRPNQEDDVETESDNPMDGMFWDPVANVQVMPYEIARGYNSMALKLNAIITAATTVRDIVAQVSAAVGHQLTPTGRIRESHEDTSARGKDRWNQ